MSELVAGLTVIVLTRDEARHIERCLASVAGLATRVIVVDSGSTDGTTDLARAAGAEVLLNSWINYATQFNWALDHTDVDTVWTMRLDADEIVLPALRDRLAALVLAEVGVTAGYTVNRRIHFLGRWIRWGGVYPSRMLRVWRTGQGRCEDRWMDEHIAVAGAVSHLDGDIADINLNNIGWWTDKHNRYASREAVDELCRIAVAHAAPTGGLGGQARARRWLKRNVYGRTPLGLRALLYFAWRYVFRLGFLDGWPGLAFHVMQGLWYRFLVDVKVHEIRTRMRTERRSLAGVVEAEYGLKL